MGKTALGSENPLNLCKITETQFIPPPTCPPTSESPCEVLLSCPENFSLSVPFPFSVHNSDDTVYSEKVQAPKDKALGDQGEHVPHCFLLQNDGKGPGPADPEDKKSSGPASDVFTEMDQAPEARGLAAHGAPPGEIWLSTPGTGISSDTQGPKAEKVQGAPPGETWPSTPGTFQLCAVQGPRSEKGQGPASGEKAVSTPGHAVLSKADASSFILQVLRPPTHFHLKWKDRILFWKYQH